MLIELGDVQSFGVDHRAVGVRNADDLPTHLVQAARGMAADVAVSLNRERGTGDCALEPAEHLSGNDRHAEARGGERLALASDDVAAQTMQIFENARTVLKAAGKSLNDVVKANVYLADIADFAAMNAAYATFFAKPYPARTTIGVAALPLGARVEIEFLVR